MQADVLLCRYLHSMEEVLKSIQDTVVDAMPMENLTASLASGLDVRNDEAYMRPEKQVDTELDWYFISKTVWVPAGNDHTIMPSPLRYHLVRQCGKCSILLFPHVL